MLHSAASIWRELHLKAPVDLIFVCQSLGIRVLFQVLTDYASTIGAVYATSGADRAVIIVNSRDSEARQRVSIAHLIGHHIKIIKSGDSLPNRSIVYDPSKPDDPDCELFAQALLMPEDGFSIDFRELTGNQWRLAIMGEHFGVPIPAICNRLHTLHLPVWPWEANQH